MMVLGQSPDRPAFTLPEVNQQLDTLRLPDAVLLNQASRGDYAEVIDQVQQGNWVTTEIGLRTITVAGLFEVGASFADDGALITSDQNFLRLFPRRSAGAVSLGLVRLAAGADPETVRADLAARLPGDVQVMNPRRYVDFELADIQSESTHWLCLWIRDGDGVHCRRGDCLRGARLTSTATLRDT